MGSEMCIRDRDLSIKTVAFVPDGAAGLILYAAVGTHGIYRSLDTCLLYTSDAADERSSVDLGGRRTIKKKTMTRQRWSADHTSR